MLLSLALKDSIGVYEMGKLKMKKENKLKNILIIGGTGFLGFSFVHYFSLNSDLKVYATYHKRKPIKIKGVHWIKIDLLEKVKVNKLFQKKFDFVINAAPVHQDQI